MIRTKRSDKVRIIKDINITPFTDVCLVLLIIFMVTASALTKETSMNVSLPKATTADTPMPASVTVRITKDLQFFVNTEKIDHAMLGPKLKQMRDSYNKTTLLVVKADESIPYHYVIETIDIARELGYVQTGLATRQPDNGLLRQP
ncbi:MAG: ExbD/TolR family protein [Armatimonadota bacterium]